MRRNDLSRRQLALALRILFAVVALAALALLAPVDWRRYFGGLRTSGGQTRER